MSNKGRYSKSTVFFLNTRVVEAKTKGRIEVTGRRGRRFEQLLGDLKEKRGYCKLKG
jgi:hypothetical protein